MTGAASRIPFNRPHIVGTELARISEALAEGHIAGDGVFGRRCQQRLAADTGAHAVLLTPSCSAALELIALLAEVGPGDEVIMPSFTFPTTAGAFVAQGATPVFVDIRSDTLNLDERQVEAAITSRTRAIVAVHYAGVGCAMDELAAIATRHDLLLLEDAAQGVLAAHRGRALGTIGDLGALSFHDSKNVTCGEGGALLVNDARWLRRAEVLQEKGTDRRRFYRGEVDKYSWVDRGSSYVLSDLNAAFLWAQLDHAEEITRRRLEVWEHYHDALAGLDELGVRRPVIPGDCRHNAHTYHLLLPSESARDGLIEHLDRDGIQAVIHYVPLHSAPAGVRYCRSAGPLPVTDDVGRRLVRLPMFPGLDVEMRERVVASVLAAVGTASRSATGSASPRR